MIGDRFVVANSDTFQAGSGADARALAYRAVHHDGVGADVRAVAQYRATHNCPRLHNGAGADGAASRHHRPRGNYSTG